MSATATGAIPLPRMTHPKPIAAALISQQCKLSHKQDNAVPQVLFACACVAAMGLAGTALVYPGAATIDWGRDLLKKPPFVSGLGPMYIAWIIMPLISCVIGAMCMLSLRNVLRKEDPFHQVVWVRWACSFCLLPSLA